jgi:ABC-type antimicrobial peptide transport system permease subunit
MENRSTPQGRRRRMRKISLAVKIAISFSVVAVILVLGLVLTLQSGTPSKQSVVKPNANSSEALTELRQVVDASVAKLGKTGWTEVSHVAHKITIFDPSSDLKYQTAEYYTQPKQDAYVLGSVDIVPFNLMQRLEEESQDYVVYKTATGLGVKYKDTVSNGTSVTEYEVSGGVLVSQVVRDRIGQKNELKAQTDFFYGLDSAGHAALVWANNHISTGGHD